MRAAVVSAAMDALVRARARRWVGDEGSQGRALADLHRLALSCRCETGVLPANRRVDLFLQVRSVLIDELTVPCSAFRASLKALAKTFSVVEEIAPVTSAGMLERVAGAACHELVLHVSLRPAQLQADAAAAALRRRQDAGRGWACRSA